MKPIVLKIEHGIPIPKQSGSDNGDVSAALKSLKVGDSILAPTCRRAGICSIARYHGIKLLTRKVGKYKVRIWRVEFPVLIKKGQR